MTEAARKRFPGAHSFADDELSRRLFHGRERESTALTHQILANRLVVLFARSGVGKTSLLAAGVAERLRSEGFLPLTARVNDIKAGPLASVRTGIESACASQGIEYERGDTTNLWCLFKTSSFWGGDLLLCPVLVLDQFEEIFTLYPESERSAFFDELSCLVRGVAPEMRRSSPTGSEPLAREPESPPAIRVVLSIREDFLAHLEEMSDRVPGLLEQRFRLLPLSREAAGTAMTAPAATEDEALLTRPFRIQPQALAQVLDFLEQGGLLPTAWSATTVEPFHLQLICQYMEEVAEAKRQKEPTGEVTVLAEDLGGEARLRRVLRSFYRTQIAAVPSWWQRRRARRLCSEFLINPQGRRLRMEESEIKRMVRVRPETLRVLAARRLLRVDQNASGNYYELSHDSLVNPIVRARGLSLTLRSMARLPFILIGSICACYSVIFLLILGGWGPGSTLGELFAVGGAALFLFAFFARIAIGDIRALAQMWRRLWSLRVRLRSRKHRLA